jgi:glutaminase
VSQAVVRSNRVTGGIRVVELQGDIRFAGAERLIREIVSTVAEEPSVTIDVSRVHSLNAVAYRMLMEVIRRLSLSGYTAYLIDPEDVVPNPDPGGGGHVTVVRSLNEIPV